MDVLTLYQSFLPAVKIIPKGGGEYAAPCPSCGGNDRFVLWPEHHSGAAGGRYLCRGCGLQGDGVQFLRDFQGMTYREACAELRIEPKAEAHGEKDKRQARQEKANWTPEPEHLPSAEWIKQAARVVAACAAGVDSGAGQDFLRERGLTVETAHKLGIGWNAADRYDNRKAWGLPEEIRPETGRPCKVWLPRGLVLPVRRKVGVVALLVRRADWKKGDTMPKYWQVKGSGKGCFCIGKAGLPVVLVESLLDAVLIWQEAGDVAAAVALTGATKKPDAGTVAFLRASPCLLCALDYDEAGKKSWPWWQEHFPMARLWPCATGKDPTEMYAAGIPVREWVQAGIADSTEPAKQHDPMPHTQASKLQEKTSIAPEHATSMPQASLTNASISQHNTQPLTTKLAAAGLWVVPLAGVGLVVHHDQPFTNETRAIISLWIYDRWAAISKELAAELGAHTLPKRVGFKQYGMGRVCW